MQSLKKEIINYLKLQDIPFKENLSSNKKLDLSVRIKNKWTFHLEAEEKKKTYDIKSWNLAKDQEPFTFIFDDLTARKILAYAPYSGMIVRDNLKNTFYLFSILDLFLMPKKRINQPVFKEKKLLKGKWIIDFRNGTECKFYDDIFHHLEKYIDERENIFLKSTGRYKDYVD
ncbi:MAG: hypothetical protein AAFZ15_06125 [Bacteroidota bacterium]